jgi:hypothetical protein
VRAINFAPSLSCGLLRSLESFVEPPGILDALLGIHSTFDSSMILFEDVVQVLHRSVSTAVAQCPFLLTVGDRGGIDRRQISVDHSRLGMGSIAECLAKQALGGFGVTER